MIILFKILIIIGAVCTIFNSYNGKQVNIPGFTFTPDIHINDISEETEAKIKKWIGWMFVLISDLIALFKIYVVLWLI